MVKVSLSVVIAALAVSPVIGFNVLIAGSARFKAAYLWKELYDRGHSVTIFNKGNEKPFPVPRESESEFTARMEATTFLEGNRKNSDEVKALIDPTKYEYVYDMSSGGKKDTKSLAELFVGLSSFKQYVLNSKARVYDDSDEMPHLVRNPVDKKDDIVESEKSLNRMGLPWCSIRQTYVCGPQNHRDIERYFFERIDQDRPICVPGHGQHLAGLGHVEDLACAMANVIGREDRTSGKVYNVQNSQGCTLDGVARAAAKVMGKTAKIIHYEPSDYTFPDGKKPFPMKPEHEFTNIHEAMNDLEWTPKYDTVEEILKDSYENEFVQAKADGKLENDFECDDIILDGVGSDTAAAVATTTPTPPTTPTTPPAPVEPTVIQETKINWLAIVVAVVVTYVLKR